MRLRSVGALIGATVVRGGLTSVAAAPPRGGLNDLTGRITGGSDGGRISVEASFGGVRGQLGVVVPLGGALRSAHEYVRYSGCTGVG